MTSQPQNRTEQEQSRAKHKTEEHPTSSHATCLLSTVHQQSIQSITVTKHSFTNSEVTHTLIPPQTQKMSSSNVGNAQTYEAGDQRVPPDSEKAQNQADPYEEGKKNSHKDNDPSTY